MRSVRLTLRTTTRALALSLVLLAATATSSRAQDTTSTANLQPTPEGAAVVVTLVDGSVLRGRVLEVTATTVRFLSALGETQVPRSAVRSVRAADAASARNDEWPEDPSRTRLFFAPTGRTLRSGEKYFSDAYVFFPSFQVGLTNSFTMGAGLSIIPGIGISDQIYYLTPKLGVVASPTLNISVGALVADAASVTDYGPFGVGYGVATFGGEDANISTGAGVAFRRGTADQSAILMLGGTQRTSRHIALVSENYYYTGAKSSALLSGGVRFIGETLSVDLAGWFATNALTFPVPYVAFIYKF